MMQSECDQQHLLLAYGHILLLMAQMLIMGQSVNVVDYSKVQSNVTVTH